MAGGAQKTTLAIPAGAVLCFFVLDIFHNVPHIALQEPAKLAVNKLIYITKKYDPEEVRRDLGEEFTVVDSAIDMPGNSGEVSEKGMHKGVGIVILPHKITPHSCE